MERDPMALALSMDIIVDIVLSYLKAGDLLSCRLVSRFWNKTTSAVLRRRLTMIKPVFTEEDLTKLEECMKTSSDFPFTGINFCKASRIDCARAEDFLQNYGEAFTRIRLDTYWTRGVQKLPLVVNHLPRLSTLEVLYSCASVPEVLGLVTVTEDAKRFKLPSVRIIRFLGLCSGFVNEETILQVIMAAPPSVRLECLDVKPAIVRALQRVGKLRSVSFMKFDAVEDIDHRHRFTAEMDQLLSTESPSLTKLDFDGLGCLSLDGLDQILFSSQHTLEELHLDGCWLSEYSWDNFPVLSKLTKLSLRVANDFCNGSLFHGRHGFFPPALKELHLCFEYSIEDGNEGPGYSSGLFVVPSVTRLDLEGFVDEDGMEQLAQSFPNVIDLRLDYGFYDGDPFKIWSVGDFKCLEKLRICNFSIEQPSKDYVNMDSFLTGIPVGICENLRKRKRVNLTDSPFNEILRDSPSILQLKDLKELIVCVKPGDEFEEVAEDIPFMSMVSMWYALEMMPNLRAKFVFERRLSDFKSYEKSDSVALETAFKHVHPHVKLERC